MASHSNEKLSSGVGERTQSFLLKDNLAFRVVTYILTVACHMRTVAIRGI